MLCVMSGLFKIMLFGEALQLNLNSLQIVPICQSKNQLIRRWSVLSNFCLYLFAFQISDTVLNDDDIGDSCHEGFLLKYEIQFCFML